MITIRYMQEYVTLAETLSYSKTAETLYTAQPAVTRHIASIESEIGETLFVRNTRHVRITEAGQVVYRSFKDILTRYESMLNEVELLSAGKVGRLIISSPYYWTEDYTEPIVSSFRKKHPKIEVEIISCQPAEGFAQILDSQSDLVLSATNGTVIPSVNRLDFTSEKLAVVMAADHRLSESSSIRLNDIRDDTLILFDEDLPYYSKFNSYVVDLLKRQNITPDRLEYTQQIDTLGLQVRETGGVSIMPYGVRHMNRSYIRTIPLDGEEYTMPMGLFYLESNDNPAVPLFLEAAKNVFS